MVLLGLVILVVGVIPLAILRLVNQMIVRRGDKA